MVEIIPCATLNSAVISSIPWVTACGGSGKGGGDSHDHGQGQQILQGRAGQPVLVERLGRGQGLHVRQGCVQLPALLLPHVEDGSLLHQVGQRFLRAGLERRHIPLGGNAVLPKEVKLFPVSLRFHHLLTELGRHPGRIPPLPDLAQDVEVVDI